MKNNPLKKIVSTIPALLTEAMVFFFSSQDGNESGALSGGITEKVARFLYRFFGNGRSEEESLIFLENLETLIRKMGHAGEHGLLMLAVFLPVTVFTRKKEGYLSLFPRLCLSFLITVILAASDEIHQLFVAGRACELTDVLIDASGALAMGLAITVIDLILRHFKNKSK